MRLGTIVMAVLFAAAPAWAQPGAEVPDEIAWRILFQLMRPRSQSAWDGRAQALWLERRGVPARFLYPLWKASERYWKSIEPYEEDLRSIHSRFAGRNDSPDAVAAARPAREKIREQLRLALGDLETEFGEEGTPHLRRLFEEIRKDTRRAGARPAGGGGGAHAH